jgi:hypothetical protein
VQPVLFMQELGELGEQGAQAYRRKLHGGAVVCPLIASLGGCCKRQAGWWWSAGGWGLLPRSLRL